MKFGKIALVALSMAFAHVAAAKDRASGPTPVGSPGDWISAADYPSAALRFDITGTTSFRLAVDVAGKPSRCDIVESSGFDVLDTATCERLMANARFSPARSAAGKLVDGSFSNRVRWVMPQGDRPPVSESLVSRSLSIDQSGKIASCHFTFVFPVQNAASAENLCAGFESSPAAYGLALRGNFQGPLADVEIEMADTFTPELRARALAPRSGYEQRGLYIHHFTVTSDHKLGKCTFEEQRGDIRLAENFCLQAQQASFDPPFAAMNKDGEASGWHITRVLLKATP